MQLARIFCILFVGLFLIGNAIADSSDNEIDILLDDSKDPEYDKAVQIFVIVPVSVTVDMNDGDYRGQNSDGMVLSTYRSGLSEKEKNGVFNVDDFSNFQSGDKRDNSGNITIPKNLSTSLHSTSSVNLTPARQKTNLTSGI